MRTRRHQSDLLQSAANGERRRQNSRLIDGISRRNLVAFFVSVSLLVACTGSFEGNPNLKLVVPLRGTGTVSVVCNGTAQSFTAPGLLLASTDALTNSGVANAGCSLQTTTGQPYDIIGTATGSAVFVSQPVQGTIQRLTPTLTPATGFALAAIPDFCPTRLSLSPDETKLVALDDPADPQSNCANTPARGSRVAVFNAVTGALLPGGLLTVATETDRRLGQVAVALDNTNLIVLEPFVSTYRLERYTLANLTTLPLQSPPLPGFSSSTDAVDVARIGGGGFAVSIGGGSGQTLNVVLQDAQSNPTVQFGAPINAVSQVDQLRAIGPANRIVNNRITDNSLTAYLTFNGLILKRDTQANNNPKVIDAARIGLTALDIVFPPDGFIWVLTGFSLQKLDPFTFPNVPIVSSVSLNGGSALALAWVIEP